MFLVALQVPPIDPPFILAVATATGLAPADVRPRLAGPGPWVLAVSANAESLSAMLPGLTKLSVRALVCDPDVAPDDSDRVIVRGLTFAADHLVATDGTGHPHPCPYESLSLIQRGTRIAITEQTTKTTQRKFSAGRALVTGGLSLTKKEVIHETKKSETSERFVLLGRNDGERDLMLYERRLNYQFLGGAMQSSSFANLEQVVLQLRSHSSALLDERVATPGFVARLPKTRTDPADLALYLVQLAHAGA